MPITLPGHKDGGTESQVKIPKFSGKFDPFAKTALEGVFGSLRFMLLYGSLVGGLVDPETYTLVRS